MRWTRNFLVLIMLVLCLELSTGCSVVVPIIVPSKIVIDDVNDPRMEVGELAEIKWSYYPPEDLDIAHQKAILVQHTILGDIRSEMTLDAGDRDLNFIFQAPTTAFIQGFYSDSAGVPSTQVAVDILYKTDYFLEATVEVTPPADDAVSRALARSFPRLGLEEPDLSRTIRFTNFVGIKDANTDQLIDYFAENLPSLPSDAPFRMISETRDQATGFGARAGSRFAKICLQSMMPDECHAVPALPGSFEVRQIMNADALVFGGALVHGGTAEEIRTSDDETVVIFRDPDSEGESIFILVALHSRVENTFAAPQGELEIVDVYLGNVGQKLVLNAFAGTSQIAAALGSWAASYSLVGDASPRLNGEIKGALIRDSLDLAAVEKFETLLTFKDVRWSVPLRDDDDLLGIPTARLPCELGGDCP